MCLVRFTIYSTHVIANSNSFTPLASLSIWVWSWDWTQSLYARRAPKRIGAICRRNQVWSIRSGPSQCGQCPQSRAVRRGASNQSSLIHSGLRHLLHFLLSHQCSSFGCQDFKLVTYSSSGDSALTDTQLKLKKACPSWLFRYIVSFVILLSFNCPFAIFRGPFCSQC